MGKAIGLFGVLALLAALSYVGLTGAYRFDAVDLKTVFDLLPVFTMVLLGTGAVSLAGGLLGFVRSRAGTGMFAVLAGIAALAASSGPLMMKSQADKVPPIHDITTNVKYPPVFVEIRKIRLAEEGVNSPDYDPAVAEEQLKAYPELNGVTFDKPYEEVFNAAVEVLNEMGLEIVATEENAGRIEATATSLWWGFKDDVVVTVNRFRMPVEVDVRSSSRVGVSDLGANAKRIETFLSKLQEKL